MKILWNRHLSLTRSLPPFSFLFCCCLWQTNQHPHTRTPHTIHTPACQNHIFHQFSYMICAKCSLDISKGVGGYQGGADRAIKMQDISVAKPLKANTHGCGRVFNTRQMFWRGQDDVFIVFSFSLSLLLFYFFQFYGNAAKCFYKNIFRTRECNIWKRDNNATLRPQAHAKFYWKSFYFDVFWHSVTFFHPSTFLSSSAALPCWWRC